MESIERYNHRRIRMRKEHKTDGREREALNSIQQKQQKLQQQKHPQVKHALHDKADDTVTKGIQDALQNVFLVPSQSDNTRVPTDHKQLPTPKNVSEAVVDEDAKKKEKAREMYQLL
eukprot:CAMPEP_0194412022 /NCGR_PEP_ID=MMETSP0176-20130528/10398_1 /TAXON_ID=216777 /ORGANISM="Proboscia alata, Strain PI-D3" /LENGTH=116 /DNA_ID=CAMNT_0039214481 /DNA_START=277 /DNA_END=623 /DNA_ORIENTATION=+